MNRYVSLLVTLLLATATLLNSACAPTADGRTTQAQGAGLGALGGAALGALLGAATGGNVGQYAAAGAALGGVAGFAYGTAVAKRKAKYARAEDWLNAEIALAHQTNARAHAYNNSLRQRVAALDRQVAVARASHDRARLGALKSQISQISTEAKQQDQREVQATNDQKAILSDSKARGASNFASYQREANSFNEAKSERGQLVGRLASLENSVDR